jgi:GT2 family glycosyltransferase
MAYNSARVLPRQMEALSRQSRQLQEIIVVDNASSDGTPALLAERYPHVKVIQLPKNLGAGGALAAGVSYAALERRHDWVWMVDDDSVPNDNAIEVLLEAAKSQAGTDNEIGMLAPLPVHRETGTPYPPLLWREGFVKPSPELLRQPIWFADLVFVSGCLVRRDVVENIGLPRPDFFMDFIDFEYCLRARTHGYRIAVVTGCHLAHEVGNARKVKLLGYSAIWPDHSPWREYYISRNMVYAAWWLYPTNRTKRFVIRHLARHACGALLFGSNKLACLKRMAQGFWDGRRASLGIRFTPDRP